MLNKFKGDAMKSDMKQDKAMVKKAVGMHDKQMHGGKKTDMGALKKGGMPMVMKDGKKMPVFAAKKAGMGRGMMADKAGRAMSSPTPDMMGRAMPKMAKGGGIESKGKTKGTMISMKRGGRTC